GRNGLATSECDTGAFGPAADRSADVQFGIETAATGEDEGAKRFEVLIHAVHLDLELGDFGVSDACLFGMDIFGKRGGGGAEIEKFVRDAEKNGREPADARLLRREFGSGSAHGSDERVEFVNGSICFDARTVLGNTLAAGKGSVAMIALTGVDAV